jgi:hypothetical protein
MKGELGILVDLCVLIIIGRLEFAGGYFVVLYEGRLLIITV